MNKPAYEEYKTHYDAIDAYMQGALTVALLIIVYKTLRYMGYPSEVLSWDRDPFAYFLFAVVSFAAGIRRLIMPMTRPYFQKRISTSIIAIICLAICACSTITFVKYLNIENDKFEQTKNEIKN